MAKRWKNLKPTYGRLMGHDKKCLFCRHFLEKYENAAFQLYNCEKKKLNFLELEEMKFCKKWILNIG